LWFEFWTQWQIYKGLTHKLSAVCLWNSARAHKTTHYNQKLLVYSTHSLVGPYQKHQNGSDLWLDLGKWAMYVCTRIKIHFIAYYNSQTQAPPRHSDTIAINKKVCFYRQLFADPIKPSRTNTVPVGPLGALIGWPVVPNCSTQCLLSLWYGQGCCGICLVHCAHNLATYVDWHH